MEILPTLHELHNPVAESQQQQVFSRQQLNKLEF
jgi:hypothetical protein